MDNGGRPNAVAVPKRKLRGLGDLEETSKSRDSSQERGFFASKIFLQATQNRCRLGRWMEPAIAYKVRDADTFFSRP